MGKEQKNSIFRLISILLVLVSVLVVFLSFFGDSGILELNKLKNKSNGIFTNIAKLKKENSRLRVEIDKLKTNSGYIEELARKEFGMVKEGEVVFLFQD
jgi:cell division protein FtsB